MIHAVLIALVLALAPASQRRPSVVLAELATVNFPKVDSVPSGVIPQIAIGAPRADVLVPGDDRGRVWVFGWDPATGSVRNALTRSLDPTPLPGIDEYLTNAFQDEAGPGDRFGASVDFTGNFDGLGFEDVAVGAPKVDALDDGQGNPIENNGRGYVFTMFPTSK